MRLASLIILFVLRSDSVAPLRVCGTYKSSEFFSFLAKFGFQKTQVRDKNATQGFIFGNITAKVVPRDADRSAANSSLPASSPSHGVILAVLDRGYFLEFYGNRSLFDKHKACSKMFAKVSTAAYNSRCFYEGKQDFLRTVPCSPGQLCPDEDAPENVVKGNQLTYRIMDSSQSRFWYVSLVSCYLDEDCQWVPNEDDFELDYDLWLVNGNPLGGNRNIFRYQYSYDSQDLFSLYIALLFMYSLLVPLQIYANSLQKHPITRLLQIGLLSEFVALSATVFHHSLFAWNGTGVELMATFGDIMEIFSQSLFMLLLLLLAMGWAVTRHELKCKTAIFTIWLSYCIVHCLLYVWKRTEVDVIEDIEEYQTIPGVIILVLRIIVMICFILSLRDTMSHEYNPDRLHFFLHFGAASLVWFIYLPLMAVVALQISALWRTKFILGITYSADTFAYIVIMHLLWPSRKEQYFLLAAQDDGLDELEELNEAPANVVHNNPEEMGENQVEDLFIGKPANKAPSSFWSKRRPKSGRRKRNEGSPESETLQYKDTSGRRVAGRQKHDPPVEGGFSLVQLSDDDEGPMSGSAAAERKGSVTPERVSKSEKLVILD